MATPVTDRARRARCTHRVAVRQAAGRQSRTMGTKKPRPSMATGMWKMTDWGLWVTFSQLMTAFDAQASTFLSKWVMVR